MYLNNTPRVRGHRRRAGGARDQELRRRRACTCRSTPTPTSPSCRGFQQNGVKMKSNILATGYSQDLLDHPIAQTIPAHRRDVLGLRPVELGGPRRSSSSGPTSRSTPGSPACPTTATYTGYIVVRHDDQGPAGGGQDRPVRRSSTASASEGGPTTAPGSVPADRPQLRGVRQGRQRELHLVRQREGRQVQGPQRREARNREAGRRPRADRAVREQHRWGHHHGPASDRSTLTRPRSSGEGSRFAGSSRRVRDRAQLVGESRYVDAPETGNCRDARALGSTGGSDNEPSDRRALRAIAGTTVAAVTVVGLAATGVGAQTSTDPGVSAKAVKLGYIFSRPAPPVRRSTTGQGVQGTHRPRQRRGRRQRAQDRGRVHRRPVVGGEPDRGAGPRAEPQGVRGGQQLLVRVPGLPVPARCRRAPWSGVATTAPTTGRRATRPCCRRLGTQRRSTASGTTTSPKVMHQLGAKKSAAIAYGASPSSTASAQTTQDYAGPAQRAQAGLHQHLGRLRQHRRRAHRPRHQELGRRRGVSHWWRRALAVLQGLEQNGVKMKAIPT